MTKQIILIFAVLCSVQVQANSRYTERDTVQHEFFHDATELFSERLLAAKICSDV